MNDHYTRDYAPPTGTRVASSDLINEFQAVQSGFDSTQAELENTLRQASGTPIAALPNAVSRAEKVLSFDASGNPVTLFAKSELDGLAAAAANSVTDAAAQVGMATAQAGIATTQAGVAATQAGIATTQASTAISQADVATTKAAEAAASAASIAGGPVTSVMGKTGIVTGIALDEGMSVIGTSTAAVAYKTYTLTASLTLTLPASPSAGQWVGVINRSATTTPVIGRNGQNIMGLAEDMTLDNANASLTLVFADATRGWVWA